MKVTLIGIDLAKSIFQVCGVNQAGKRIFNRQVRRARLMELLIQHPEATFAMEACSGSNFWGRVLQQRGFQVMLIPPQHVKPFVKGNKNDRNDAFAITEAARRPDLNCVEPRTLAQTDLIQVHRVLDRMIRQRTALINQIRGFLNEYGIVYAQGKEKLLAAMPDLLEDAENGLTPSSRSLYQEMYKQRSSLLCQPGPCAQGVLQWRHPEAGGHYQARQSLPSTLVDTGCLVGGAQCGQE